MNKNHFDCALTAFYSSGEEIASLRQWATSLRACDWIIPLNCGSMTGSWSMHPLLNVLMTNCDFVYSDQLTVLMDNRLADQSVIHGVSGLSSGIVQSHLVYTSWGVWVQPILPPHHLRAGWGWSVRPRPFPRETLSCQQRQDAETMFLHILAVKHRATSHRILLLVQLVMPRDRKFLEQFWKNREDFLLILLTKAAFSCHNRTFRLGSGVFAQVQYKGRQVVLTCWSCHWGMRFSNSAWKCK